MKKILLILLLILIPINVHALEYPTLHYKNAIIYDLTDNKELYELNSNEKISIASLTKLMTIITAIENNNDLNKKIIYTQEMQNNVAWNASKTGFQIGDELTINDLLYGAMLPSGADATVALAITTSNSLEEFINLMNRKAKEIGMTNSNFVNVHGLDENNHYSTAEDIKKLLEYSLKNESFKKIYSTSEYTLSTGKKIKSTVKKHSDKLNLDITKILGSKTGTTGNAGLCISVLMNHQKHEIIIITFGAPLGNNPYNITDSNELINFIENNYSNQTLINKNTLIKEIPVKNSKIDTYKIKSSKEIIKFLEKDYSKDNFKIKYTGLNELSYKNKYKEKIGVIKYYYNDKKISQENVYLTTKIEPDILKIINSNKWIIISITLFIIVLIFIIILLNKKLNKKQKRK